MLYSMLEPPIPRTRQVWDGRISAKARGEMSGKPGVSGKSPAKGPDFSVLSAEVLFTPRVDFPMRRVQSGSSQAATASHHAAAFDEDLAIAAALVRAVQGTVSSGSSGAVQGEAQGRPNSGLEAKPASALAESETGTKPPLAEQLTDVARLLIRYDPAETGGACGGIPGSIVSQLNFVLSRWGMTRKQLNARCRALYAQGWRPTSASVQETGIGRQKALTVVVNGSGADCAGEI
jgi:hypothetical protein